MSAPWKLLCLIQIIALCSQHVHGQANKVSPKLDFDDGGDQKSNSSVGGTEGRSNGSNYPGSNTNKGDDNSGTGSGSSGGGSKAGPKIHGVRVTVDTGDGQKSKESKESVEITDVGKHKKRVGIHTDITFEITADGEVDANATSSAQRSDKEDASVPIYKGRSSNRDKTRKPYDPKSRWNPNFSAERRSYDSGSRHHYPQYPGNIPVYTAGGGRGDGGSIYRSEDSWNTYVPVWTTERSSYADPYPYRPNAVTGYRATPSWKPCYCITSAADNRRRRDSHTHQEGGGAVMRPNSGVIQVVDAKLEQPFNK